MYKIIIMCMILFSIPAFSQHKFLLECDDKVLELSLGIALEQVGAVETGNNHGYLVNQYLASVGLKSGNPYCAAGQYWCFMKACDSLNFPYYRIPIPRTGLAIAIYNHAVNAGKRDIFKAKRHDLVVWIKMNGINGHIERIVKAERMGWVQTVGFNTRKVINNRTVEGVHLQKRNLYSLLSTMRLKGLVGFIPRRNI